LHWHKSPSVVQNYLSPN